jgi:DNA-binding LytR/AlgR family response regulator
MISCYIIDDEDHAIDILSKYVNRTPYLELVGTESNPLVALDKLSSGQITPDITFLDINMPQLSGMELSELIHFNTLIVFTTAFSNYAIQAFENNALDYLMKPISYERFLKAISKVQLRRQNTSSLNQKKDDNDYFFIKSEMKGKMIKVSFNDIHYIETLQNYIHIHTHDDNHVTYLTMAEIYDKLPLDVFSRIHKSFIVNIKKIKYIEGNRIFMENKKDVVIGESYRKDFFDGINQKVIKSKRKP